MKYYAAILRMRDFEKNYTFRPEHIAFLTQGEAQGKIFARGRFADETGGLVIYMVESLEEARNLAESDPYVSKGARTLELHEWEMRLPGKQSS